ncbi:hypothetical protein [Tenacibaculum jejuense]|uniref:hypothetical protein n=1 Tax=Tenacibaculum jejuense TaxID=584609 RepID=UPI0012FE3ABC|nr:hypothetical protein [Tenacibaculum jejuense]
MKNLLKLDGVKILQREQLQQIKGSIRTYCKGRNRCCFQINGTEYCEPGRCSIYGCMFY